MSILHKIGFFLKDHAPEILVISGVGMGIGAVITAAVQTPKAIEAKKQFEENRGIIRTAHELGETVTGEKYTEEDYKKDLLGEYIQGTWRIIKPYLPTIGLTVGSVACTLGGFGILKRRHAATLAILSSTVSQFDAYRARVAKELGDDKEKDVYYALEEAEITEIDEKGKKITKKEKYVLDDQIDCPALLGPYAIKLDITNPGFRRNGGDPLYMDTWLSILESTLNTKLHMRGFLFLADVLEELEVTPDTYPNINTDIAHQVGWIDGYKDGVVDFGCFRYDEGTNERKLELVRGRNGCCYLDFNCSPILGLTKDVKTSAQKKLEAIQSNPYIEK